MRYLTRQRAATHITEQTGIRTTAQALADQARRGGGPRYGIVSGRAVYTQDAIDDWITEQVTRPVRRRSAARARVAAP